jgi:phage-related protein
MYRIITTFQTTFRRVFYALKASGNIFVIRNDVFQKKKKEKEKFW